MNLSDALKKELAEWDRKGYAELAALTYPIVYERGTKNDPNWYEVEVEFLEKNERYIQIMIAVDDGGISAFCPPSYSLVIYAPGAQ
jgi:hypothetical protein